MPMPIPLLLPALEPLVRVWGVVVVRVVAGVVEAERAWGACEESEEEEKEGKEAEKERFVRPGMGPDELFEPLEGLRGEDGASTLGEWEVSG